MRVPLFIGALAVVAAATVGCGSAATPGTPAPTSAPAPNAGQDAGKKAAEGVRGQITAETGAMWTVTTAAGKAFTVTVDPQTVFGSKDAPATATQFPVGTTVRVTGARNGSAVTATRIALAKDKAAGASGTPTPAQASTAPGA